MVCGRGVGIFRPFGCFKSRGWAESWTILASLLVLVQTSSASKWQIRWLLGKNIQTFSPVHFSLLHVLKYPCIWTRISTFELLSNFACVYYGQSEKACLFLSNRKSSHPGKWMKAWTEYIACFLLSNRGKSYPQKWMKAWTKILSLLLFVQPGSSYPGKWMKAWLKIFKKSSVYN